MTDLDQMERLARECIATSLVAETIALARFVLDVMPVVRAAVAWSESFGELSKRLPPHVHELRRAVDEFEHAIDQLRRGGG